MKPVTEEEAKGSRIAIIMNGSPLFTGDAGSGESEIRRYLLENDLVEAIVAMPDQLFYNTGISTYVWILTNKKDPLRIGKVQLIDGTSFYQKMKKSLGNKRHELSQAHIDEIVRIYGSMKEGEHCKIFDNADFGYQKIVVERPLRLNFIISDARMNELSNQAAFRNLAVSRKKGQAGLDEIEEGKQIQQRIVEVLTSLQDGALFKDSDVFIKKLKKAFKDKEMSVGAPLLKAIITAMSERDETAEVCKDSKGNLEADTDLRDTENVPLKEDIHEYFEREVKPHVPDAWIDESKTKIGYEIPFTRYFYKYTPLRSSEELMVEIKELETSILDRLKKVLG